MRNTIRLSRPATTAIAAVLAFTATPLLAQETGSVPLPLPSPPPASTAPVAPVMLPSTASAAVSPVTDPASTTGTTSGPGHAPTVSRPVVQAVPVDTPAERSATGAASQNPASTTSDATSPVGRVAGATGTNAARRVITSEAVTNPGQSAGQAVLAAPLSNTAQDSGSAPVVVAQIPEATIAPMARSADEASDDRTELLLGALLAALAAGGLGAVILSGRRRRAKAGAVPLIERPRVEQAEPAVVDSNPPRGGTVQSTAFTVAAPVAREHPRPAPASVTTASVFAAQANAARSGHASLAAQGSGLSHAGAAIALPRTLPASVEERRALVERMVAARPDRANPFRTPKARRHRARLIMQCIGRTFENKKSRIDFSQYALNWPELAQNRNAAA